MRDLANTKRGSFSQINGNDFNKQRQQSNTNSDHDESDDVEISDLIGHWGKYQLQIFLFKITIGVTSAFNNLGITFSAPQEHISYQCVSAHSDTGISISSNNNNNVTTTNLLPARSDQCRLSNGSKCTEWIYNTGVWRSTMIEEWNLVCDRSWLISLSQSCYMASFILAYLIFGPLSDRYGRFPCLLMGATLEVLAGLGCALSTSVTMFIVFRFVLGFGCAGRSSASYLIMIEWVGRKYRMHVSAMGSLGWIVGYCLMPWLVKYFMHFRHLQLLVCAYEFVIIAWLLTIPESPRWLLTHNQLDKARRVLLKAAQTNQYALDTFELKFMQFEQTISAKKFAKNEHKPTMIDLFRWPNLRTYTMILFFVWACDSFIYYGIALRMSQFGRNLFVNFTLAGLTELPATFFAILCMKFMPRRTTNLIIFITTGTCCALMVPVKYYNLYVGLTLLAMMNKMLISIAFISVLYQTIEIFPTTMRQTASSACSLAGRIGSTTAPFIKEMASATNEFVPPLIYATMAFVCAGAIMTLPETRGIELPDTMEEAENVGKSKCAPRGCVPLDTAAPHLPVTKLDPIAQR
ncbi:Solute carrier family 22 member 1 [Fragariocoptes setiger]|uniref:Solute carrier family 22 member 1 n=1 Tax=Fragariocoptes setiger TaxID=1670756 RepID=A0ABQ7SDD3_9ACAR|nr:Solute carrier family 22 member 1 [Fragariocoptes setiger]